MRRGWRGEERERVEGYGGKVWKESDNTIGSKLIPLSHCTLILSLSLSLSLSLTGQESTRGQKQPVGRDL